MLAGAAVGQLSPSDIVAIAIEPIRGTRPRQQYDQEGPGNKDGRTGDQFQSIQQEFGHGEAGDGRASYIGDRQEIRKRRIAPNTTVQSKQETDAADDQSEQNCRTKEIRQVSNNNIEIKP